MSGLLDSVADTVEGGTNADNVSSSLDYTVNGTTSTTAVTVPVTPVVATGLVVPAHAVAAQIVPTQTGEIKLGAGNFTAVLAGKNADGTASLLSPYTIPCVLDEGQDASVDTVKVVKADTQTVVKARYLKAKKAIKANVTVKDGAIKATGKVRVVLKKGKKTVAKRTVKLNKRAKANVTFKRIRAKGVYKVKVNYLGDKNHKRSKKTVKVRVR